MNKQDVQKALESTNLCDEYSDEDLQKMGTQLCKWYDVDMDSRKSWFERSQQWLKLATQVVEKKTYPWPDSANVKFPLLTTAAMQFAARAYPALVPGPNLVGGMVVGQDGEGKKAASAQRVGRHMSYQLLYQMKGWEEDMDRLCIMLPIVGCIFKKTYYDESKKRNVSDLILPQDLVIDYYAKSLSDATRMTHVIYKSPNQVRERVLQGLWRDVKLTRVVGQLEDNKTKDRIDGMEEPEETPATPYKFIECHCWWDSDDDGYEEPYIVTVEYESKQVVRIVARYELDGVELNEKDEVIKITPVEYFTKFGFIPNPDGSIYDLGFGILLGGINETVNTLTNQLLDAGTLSILQSGFLGKGIRIRGGNTRFIPGEWKPVDFTGDDIKKHIFSIPTKEPSNVLFQLLETLVTSGKELASVAEIMVGKMPGQNTPATTTMASIEQGLKVFTAIYKRVYRSLGCEYEKLFRLNSLYSDDKVYFTINEPQGPTGQEVYKTDYDPENIGVKPNADPNIVSQAQKLMQVQSMGAVLQLGTINPQVYTKRYLEAIGEENIAELMGDGQGGPYVPPPPPEAAQMQGEMQMQQQKMQGEQQKAQAEAMIKSQLAQQQAQIDAYKAQLDSQSKQLDMAIKVAEARMEERKAMMEMMHIEANARLDRQHQQDQHEMDKTHAEDEHQQNMKHQDDAAKAKVEATKAQAAAKPKSQGTK